MKEKPKKMPKEKSEMGMKVSKAPKQSGKMKKGFSEAKEMKSGKKMKGMVERCK